MAAVTLYHFPYSAPSRGALLAARAVGVPVEIKEINLFEGKQLEPDFIKINPQHTIPTLKDDDFVLWDSHAIASYLVTAYGKDDKLYPRNPQQKAIVDQRLYFDVGILYRRVREIFFPVVRLGEKTVGEEKKKSMEEALGWMDQFLTGRPWLAGTEFTIADCWCAASISTLGEMGYDISSHRKTSEWYEKCKTELPGFDENLEGAKILGDAFKQKVDPGQI
uniref:Glutathione s-transferase D1 n=1 Tax=Nilaparvata lugens TaxID=108931 RepID=J9Q527_NILLU|nr:glutathione s-transferase D1 [Nilaparvata lugens]